MPKTTYTNADLSPARRGEKGFVEPKDIVGDWKFSNPEDARAELAWLSGQDINGGASADSVLADAKQALTNFRTGHEQAVLREQGGRAPMAAPDPFTEYMAGLGGASTPSNILSLLSMAGGPVGAVAGGVLTGKAGMDFVNQPNIGSGVEAGLGMLGLGSALRGAKGAAKGVRQSVEVPYRRTAEEVGDVLRRTPSKPVPVASVPSATVTRAHADDLDILGGLDRNMPNAPNPKAGAASPFDAATYLQTGADDIEGSKALIDRFMPNTPAAVAPKALAPAAAAPAPSVADSLADLSAQGEMITDPRRMLPAFGETSATGKLAGQPTLKELVQKLTPGVKVKALKGFPNPSGKDATSKAIRQRGHIAKSYEFLKEDPR